MLGKRKRETAVAPRRKLNGQDEEQTPVPATVTVPSVDHEVFRRHFESIFEPLPEHDSSTPTLDADEETEQSDHESEWEGLSEPGSDVELETPKVEIVEHQTIPEEEDDTVLQRQQYKTFMSSKPPKEDVRVTMTHSPQEADGEDDLDALNLKHDLDLQRLLKESHLLEPAKASSSPGSHRHKTVDMRMQSLGSKESLFHQEKMPLAHRRGILAKAAMREVGRRTDAQENGIILEKATAKSRARDVRRERGVDAPTVGKFRGGTLRLSKKDILDIQGPARSGPRAKTRRR